MAPIQPLSIVIATGDDRSLTRQIIDAVRLPITTGDLETAARLPSVRGLAEQLGINPNTVAKAHTQLTNEGWLSSQSAQGVFVAPQRQRINRSTGSGVSTTRWMVSSARSSRGNIRVTLPSASLPMPLMRSTPAGAPE